MLANTEVLHEKINILSNRVRHLEDALSQSHALHSNHLHPLLTEELLQIKRPLERERTDQPSTTDDKSEPGEAIDALGSLRVSTLTIDPQRYIQQNLGLFPTAAKLVSTGQRQVHG